MNTTINESVWILIVIIQVLDLSTICTEHIQSSDSNNDFLQSVYIE